MALQSICMLAQVFRDSVMAGPPEHWCWSIKYDGQRALWTGQGLVSRYGKPIFAPDWWIQENIPDLGSGLDGELWLGRGQFQELRSIVSRHVPDRRWASVRYIPFDLVKWTGHRFMALGSFERNRDRLVGQHILGSWDHLSVVLDDELARGGEGIMLRHRYSTWEPRRSWNLLKMKPEKHGVGVLVGINPGQGRLSGMIGSLRVRWSGVEFDISGLTDAERQQVWRVGDKVSFKYVSLTDKGVPREARYSRCN